MVEGMRLVKFPKKLRDLTSQKNPTSLIKKSACTNLQGNPSPRDLGWVDFDFGYSTVCLILLGQVRVWQNG